uniref:Uncharacterized protein n=1 Tax=Tanacetum cinerariifolium TaxID=118510 RepID=A0A6L2MS90_TANCI|nr:hypothetical protein [Tanacetum cinerariifolium]
MDPCAMVIFILNDSCTNAKLLFEGKTLLEVIVRISLTTLISYVGERVAVASRLGAIRAQADKCCQKRSNKHLAAQQISELRRFVNRMREELQTCRNQTPQLNALIVEMEAFDDLSEVFDILMGLRDDVRVKMPS